MASDAPPKAEQEDVVVLGPPTADGDGVHVIRSRNRTLEAGELRALREGKPIVGEMVTLQPRKDDPRICDVRQSYKPPAPALEAAPEHAARKGPANVATKAYRDGWDEVFKKDLN